MSGADFELSIACTALKGHVPLEGALEDRLRAAMRYAHEHERDLYWMSLPTDDKLFRTALGAVMLTCSEEDRDRIARSIAPLKAINALFSGVPVDLEQALGQLGDDVLPLIKLWDEAKKPLTLGEVVDALEADTASLASVIPATQAFDWQAHYLTPVRCRVKLRAASPEGGWLKAGLEKLNGEVIDLEPLWCFGTGEQYAGEWALGFDHAGEQWKDVRERFGVGWIASGDVEALR